MISTAQRPTLTRSTSAANASTSPSSHTHWLFLALFCMLTSGCPQLPKEIPTSSGVEKKVPSQRLKPHNPRKNPLLPLPMRSLHDIHLSLRKKKFLVAAPPSFKDPKLYPCSACHTGTPNRARRKLVKEHQKHKMRHGGPHMWCFHCHSPNKVDQLRLADDSSVSFKQSHLLCFQCHGDKAREWVAGVHGKTTGYWKGPQRYLLCTHCHDPHNPKPYKIKPMPMPKAPHLIKPVFRR